MSVTFLGKFGTGAGYGSTPQSVTLPNEGFAQWATFDRLDGSGNPARFRIVWINTAGPAGLEAGCEGPLPPPPPPP